LHTYTWVIIKGTSDPEKEVLTIMKEYSGCEFYNIGGRWSGLLGFTSDDGDYKITHQPTSDGRDIQPLSHLDLSTVVTPDKIFAHDGNSLWAGLDMWKLEIELLSSVSRNDTPSEELLERKKLHEMEWRAKVKEFLAPYQDCLVVVVDYRS